MPTCLRHQLPQKRINGKCKYQLGLLICMRCLIVSFNQQISTAYPLLPIPLKKDILVFWISSIFMAVHGRFLVVALLVPDCDQTPLRQQVSQLCCYCSLWPSPPVGAPFRVRPELFSQPSGSVEKARTLGSLPTCSWAASVLGAPRPFVLGSVPFAGVLLPTFICPVFME